jgi:SAM-dependent methyltransferase
MRRVRRHCWCGCKSARLISVIEMEDGERFPLVQCLQCKVHALHPAPTDEQLMKYYSAEYYGKSRKKFVGPIARFVERFQQGRSRQVAWYLRTWKPANETKPQRILDVGCGNGGFLLQMRRAGYEVEGTEWTRQSAKRVPGMRGVPIHVGDLLDIDLPPESFDAITLWHVFEHLRAPDLTLEKIHRLLKPGGLLFLAMPNHESWQAWRFGTNWFHLDPPRHLHGFGVKSLLVLLTIKQFQWLRVTTFSLEQNPYGFLQSILNAFGYPRDRAYSVLKGTSRDPLEKRLKDLALVVLLTPFALIYSTVESLAGAGATMTVIAQKRK